MSVRPGDDPWGPYKCEVCGKLVDTYGALCIHRQVNHSKVPDETMDSSKPAALTSNPSGEVSFPCGHTVAHEEDCPRCQIERLERERDERLAIDTYFISDNSRLRTALERYGWHEPGCPLERTKGVGHERRCTCGYSKALRGEVKVSDE
jgi:hypothetical protein